MNHSSTNNNNTGFLTDNDLRSLIAHRDSQDINFLNMNPSNNDDQAEIIIYSSNKSQDQLENTIDEFITGVDQCGDRRFLGNQLSLVVQVNNDHFIAINLTRNDSTGQVSYRYANSLRGDQQIDQVIKNILKTNGAQELPFTPQIQGQSADDINNCGIYAVLALQSMRNNQDKVDIDPETVVGIRKAIANQHDNLNNYGNTFIGTTKSILGKNGKKIASNAKKKLKDIFSTSEQSQKKRTNKAKEKLNNLQNFNKEKASESVEVFEKIMKDISEPKTLNALYSNLQTIAKRTNHDKFKIKNTMKNALDTHFSNNNNLTKVQDFIATFLYHDIHHSIKDTGFLTGMFYKSPKSKKFNKYLKSTTQDTHTQKELIKSILHSDILFSVTGMQGGKGMIKQEDCEKLKKLCTGADDNLDKDLLSSITGMQNGRGMIKQEDFKRLITLCDGKMRGDTIETKPDKDLLKSITGMQNGKGMIKTEDFKRLITLCGGEMRGDTIDKQPDTDLLRSITGMQNGRGMIKKEDCETLMDLCTGDDGNLDKDLLRSITGMQNGKGMIKTEDFKRLITLCGGEIDDKHNITKKPNTDLLSSITGMQNGKGMIGDDECTLLKELFYSTNAPHSVIQLVSKLQEITKHANAANTTEYNFDNINNITNAVKWIKKNSTETNTIKHIYCKNLLDAVETRLSIATNNPRFTQTLDTPFLDHMHRLQSNYNKPSLANPLYQSSLILANTNIQDTKIDGKIQFVKTNEANSCVNFKMLANSNIQI